MSTTQNDTSPMTRSQVLGYLYEISIADQKYRETFQVGGRCGVITTWSFGFIEKRDDWEGKTYELPDMRIEKYCLVPCHLTWVRDVFHHSQNGIYIAVSESPDDDMSEWLWYKGGCVKNVVFHSKVEAQAFRSALPKPGEKVFCINGTVIDRTRREQLVYGNVHVFYDPTSWVPTDIEERIVAGYRGCGGNPHYRLQATTYMVFESGPVAPFNQIGTLVFQTREEAEALFYRMTQYPGYAKDLQTALMMKKKQQSI